MPFELESQEPVETGRLRTTELQEIEVFDAEYSNAETEEDRLERVNDAQQKLERLFQQQERVVDASQETEQEGRVAWDELKKIDRSLKPIMGELADAAQRKGVFRVLNILNFPLILIWKRERKKLIASRESHLQVIQKEIAEFSIDPQDFFHAVEESDSFNFYKRLRQNISRMRTLEKASSGAVKRLWQNYGIRCFARYPEKTLLRQLEQEEDLDTPYGVVVHSRADWNGAFYGSLREHPIESLDTQTEAAGLGLRVFECGSLFEATRQLIKLDRKYGGTQKIQFAYLAGHGSETAIELGKDQLVADTLPTTSLKEIATFFVDDPTLIVSACLTAKEDIGIAALLARATGAETIASTQEASGAYISKIEKIGDKYKFKVFYQRGSNLWEKGPSVKVVEPRVIYSQREKQ